MRDRLPSEFTTTLLCLFFVAMALAPACGGVVAVCLSPDLTGALFLIMGLSTSGLCLVTL